VPDTPIKWVTPLELQDVPGMEEFRLLADLIVQANGVEYRAPADMRSDGMSAPRLLWVFEGHPWSGPYRRPAVMHDAAYRGLLTWRNVGEQEWTPEPLTRAEADTLFRILVDFEQTLRLPEHGWRRYWRRLDNFWSRWKKWAGLRWFGARNYKARRVCG